MRGASQLHALAIRPDYTKVECVAELWRVVAIESNTHLLAELATEDAAS